MVINTSILIEVIINGVDGKIYKVKNLIDKVDFLIYGMILTIKFALYNDSKCVLDGGLLKRQISL